MVSRVAPNSPAETAVPKLSEGDQVLRVNGTDVDSLNHDEVVSLIRGTKDSVPGGQLVLLIRPNVYTQTTQEGQEVTAGEDEPNFEYVPVDASPASKARVRTGDRLYESIMLLQEGLETHNVITQFNVSPLLFYDKCKWNESFNREILRRKSCMRLQRSMKSTPPMLFLLT